MTTNKRFFTLALGHGRAIGAALLLLAGTFGSPVLASPEVPGAPQSRPIALIGGKVFPQSGPPIENATVLFDKGKIVAVGNNVTIPPDAERIDIRGKHIYPGLIDANTRLGLVEIPSVRGSVDFAESVSVSPNVRAEVAFNPDSDLIPVARSGGVLSVLSVPGGNLINGLSACMTLDGWTWEDMCVCCEIGLHVNWPTPRGDAPQANAGEAGERTAPEARDDRALRELRQAFADARAYRAAGRAYAEHKASAPEHNARWEAMRGVLDGKIPVFFTAEDVRQIQASLAFAEQEGVRAVIVGGYDAVECAALLKQRSVPVVVGGVHRLPRRRGDAFDAAYTLPARLQAAGIKYCIASPVGADGSNVRNLGHHAGTAAAYGLSSEEAMKAVTLYPAQILGLAERIGAVDPGKEATLIVTTGDPLEVTSEVIAAYIQGREVSLSDRHKRLWDKYKEKYRRMGIEN